MTQIRLMDLSTQRKFYKQFKSEAEAIKYRFRIRRYFTNIIEIKEWN